MAALTEEVVLPVAASSAVADVLARPCAPAHVLGATTRAVHLQVPDGAVVSLLATDGLRLPCAVLVPPPATGRLRPEGVRVALVGDDRIQLGPVQLRVARWWPPARPRAPRSGRPDPAPLDDAHLPATLRRHLADLIAALSVADGSAACAAATRMLGLGPGLTPSGDDVLAGVLIASVLCSSRIRSTVQALGAHVLAIAPERTTALSAQVLRHAAAGTALPQLAAYVDALGGWGDPADALTRLVAVGSTSGRDLACGVRAAAALAEAARVAA